MKKLLVLVLLVAFGVNLNAQIITFKDAKFKAKLLESSPNNYIARDSNNTRISIDLNQDGEN